MRLLRPPANTDPGRARFLEDLHEQLGYFEGKVAGYAFVVWDEEGGSSASAVGTCTIPGILVPDFVRNRLLAYKIEDWTIETVNKSWKPPSK